MTPAAPARLIGFFAIGAPVCVIARRGPSRYTRLILWDIENDTFTPGQWFRGKIDHATMTRDGRYMAIGIMGNEQVAVICRPPYITALEAWVNGLCLMTLAFLPDDGLVVPSCGGHKVHAQSPCPFIRVSETERAIRSRYGRRHEWVIDARRETASGTDQKGRSITFEDGCVYVNEGGAKRLLLDTNPMQFEPLEAPAWARDW